jgi:hypothetical protein
VVPVVTETDETSKSCHPADGFIAVSELWASRFAGFPDPALYNATLTKPDPLPAQFTPILLSVPDAERVTGDATTKPAPNVSLRLVPPIVSVAALMKTNCSRSNTNNRTTTSVDANGLA